MSNSAPIPSRESHYASLLQTKASDSNGTSPSESIDMFPTFEIEPAAVPNQADWSPTHVAYTENTLVNSGAFLNLLTSEAQHTGLISGPSPSVASTVIESRSSMERNNSSSKPVNNCLFRSPSHNQILAGNAESILDKTTTLNSESSSPMLSAVTDVTPLPSPVIKGGSPDPWRRIYKQSFIDDSKASILVDTTNMAINSESSSPDCINEPSRPTHQSLMSKHKDSTLRNLKKVEDITSDINKRNRSHSEYSPKPVHVLRSRNITVLGAHAPLLESTSINFTESTDMPMRREPNLACQRGIGPMPHPPTPPSSRMGYESSDSESPFSSVPTTRGKKARYNYFEAYGRTDMKLRKWKALKILGQGTFSKVILATSQLSNNETEHSSRLPENPRETAFFTIPLEKLDAKKFVAVKVCEHGSKGNFSEERVEISVKRELEFMKSISHPSIVNLKAWNIEETRTIFVLSYCPGGDLFEVASEHPELLVPDLLRRIFSELVAAVIYLHDRHIVHRDIKLENVLVNVLYYDLSRQKNWITYPYSLITLTDLGLARYVSGDEKLTTRCGSDDYAAPELIMGQQYDGRATDAWSLGVLLYALVESRLPFDPHPNVPDTHKQRSRTSHRIARVEWDWVKYACQGDDHEGDPDKFCSQGIKGVKEITEGLLRRVRDRWTLQEVAATEWVSGGVQVKGGLQFREENLLDESDI
ncbi:serine/threonine-protein kinase [Blumeria hordei DH14]|uniref:Serine/threonine-protein kinase n=1 Tax=Blumeria graminis f. sp. hordei (strain DH14) TaxID=546991 RepID=N1JG50_BLUG1|nr:serine/threonine-protein kinase [Blumeria hordei DH14]